MTELRDKLTELCDEVKAEGILFCFDMQSLSSSLAYLESEGRLYNALFNRRMILTTDLISTNFWQRQVVHMTTHKGFRQRFYAQSDFWFYKKNEVSRLEPSVVHSYLLPIPATKVACRFMLLYDTREKWLESNMADIESRLYLWMANLNIGDYNNLNVFLDYKIISKVSHMVLQCLAAGQSRNKIAKEMRLTLRGVDYHVSLLKQSLRAKNTANLIFSASLLRLI
ncbi:LuxR C-terminal-related transcriptional regulator [Nitrincola sp.]|uniref:LuxR C-terminal-related transcriptional regulator n=1 Tax=Nitrincola sp. TaxID=1926584 RepID=UPI003A95A07B